MRVNRFIVLLLLILSIGCLESEEVPRQSVFGVGGEITTDSPPPEHFPESPVPATPTTTRSSDILDINYIEFKFLIEDNDDLTSSQLDDLWKYEYYDKVVRWSGRVTLVMEDIVGDYCVFIDADTDVESDFQVCYAWWFKDELLEFNEGDFVVIEGRLKRYNNLMNFTDLGGLAIELTSPPITQPPTTSTSIDGVPSEPVPTGYTSYTHPKNRFKLNYPSDWIIENDDEYLDEVFEGENVELDNSNMLMITSPLEGSNDEMLENVLIISDEHVEYKLDNLDEIVELNLASFEPSFEIIETSSTKLSGHPAKKIILTDFDGFDTYKMLQIYSLYEDKFILIQYTALEGTYLSHIDEAQNIIDSFTFI